MSDTREPGQSSAPLLICYDGSPHAAEAISFAAALLPGAPAAVLTVWQPIIDAILAVSLGHAPPISDIPDVDDRQHEAAVEVAEEGTQRAREAGLDARPLTRKARGAVGTTIALVADEEQARLIVCATRHSGLTSTVLDTVPAALVHHATRPVTVVPSSAAVAERRHDLARERRSRTRAV